MVQAQRIYPRFRNPGRRKQPLRLSLNLNPEIAKRIHRISLGLPELTGSPIRVLMRPQLTAYRGELLSGHPVFGNAVYAASFIRKRRIVLETELLKQPLSLRLILIHEIFHFVWARLGNRLRREYATLLNEELKHGAKGELGESSNVRKTLLTHGSRHARDYVCESFCDSAAWLYAGVKHHPEFTLARRWSKLRKSWFDSVFAVPRAC